MALLGPARVRILSTDIIRSDFPSFELADKSIARSGGSLIDGEFMKLVDGKATRPAVTATSSSAGTPGFVAPTDSSGVPQKLFWMCLDAAGRLDVVTGGRATFVFKPGLRFKTSAFVTYTYNSNTYQPVEGDLLVLRETSKGSGICVLGPAPLAAELTSNAKAVAVAVCTRGVVNGMIEATLISPVEIEIKVA